MGVEVLNVEIKGDEAIAFAADLHADSHPPSSRVDVDYIHTTEQKLKSILDSCKYHNVKLLIFGGDLFHRVTTTFECVRRIGSMLLNFKKEGIMVGSIVGNHDLARNQIEKMAKSPLSMLFDFGVVERLSVERRIVINKKTLITPVGYMDRLVRANPKAGVNILVAHLFYEVSDYFGKEHILNKEIIKDLGYNAVFLGHDHVNYPIIRVDGTDIVRPGSIMRGTTHNYNFDRKVGFYVLHDPTNYDSENYEFVEIPVKPMNEVVSSLIMNKKDNLADLSDLMGELVSKLTEGDGKYDGILETVRKDSSIPQPVRAMLMEYFSEAGILSGVSEDIRGEGDGSEKDKKRE